MPLHMLCSLVSTLGVKHISDLPESVPCKKLSGIITIHENESFLSQLLVEQLARDGSSTF